MKSNISNIEPLEKVWNASNDEMVLSDKNGVVLKANQQYGDRKRYHQITCYDNK